MHVNRGLLGWGVFFIALGAVPLLVQSGAVEAATARRAWELWPLLVIGAGLALVLRNTPLLPLSNVLSGLTLGLIAGGLVVGGISSAPVAFCGSGSGRPPGQPAAGTLGAQASVSLSVDCGSMTVASQPGSGWSVSRPTGDGLDPQISASADQLRVELGAKRGLAIGSPGAHWDVALPTDPDLDLSVAVNAGSAKASLGGARVSSVSASVNAGDARVDLTGAIGTASVNGSANAGSLSLALPTPQGTLSGSLSANAGSIRICVPAGVALRIRVDDEPLGSDNFGQRGLTRIGDAWTRSGTSGSGEIRLSVSANLGSITLDPEDGCG